MGRLFGTDGIRGVANVDLRPTIAYALGRATAKRLAEPGAAIVVGQDTRRSGDMFVAAIVAGATSLGVDVHVVGVVPTPALAYLARSGQYRAGIMVSASHNPADDNGLKVLDADGLKLDDAIEDELEALIWREGELGGVGNAALGRRIEAADTVERYLEHRRSLAGSIDASGLHIVLDGANGSGGAAGTGDPRRDGRPGRRDPRRARRRQHQRRVGGDLAGVARPRGRASAAPMSASRSTATPIG